MGIFNVFKIVLEQLILVLNQRELRLQLILLFLKLLLKLLLFQVAREEALSCGLRLFLIVGLGIFSNYLIQLFWSVLIQTLNYLLL